MAKNQKVHDDGINVSVSPKFFKRLFGGTAIVGGGVGATVLANSGLDGGVFKNAMSALEKGGPGVITFLVVALIFVWNSWANDRKKHERRDYEAARLLNRALARGVDERKLRKIFEDCLTIHLGRFDKGRRG